MRRARVLWLVAAALLLAYVAGADPAHASLPGPAFFDTGFVDEPAFESPIDWSLRAERLGSTWTRLTVAWAAIAPASLTPGFRPADPADPRYSFTILDAYVENAVAHHQRVILMPLDAPTWAERNPPAMAVPGSWRPKPAALGAFMRALAIRYSGSFPDPLRPGRTLPKVSYFQPWNEPNIPGLLSPQWTRARNGRLLPASPGLYRAMLDAAYANVKAVQPHAYVIAAGTATYGDPPGGYRMTPVVFLREMLCLHGDALTPERCRNPAHFDAIDHHLYAANPTRHAANPDNVSLPDLGRLERILRTAERARRALPAGPKALWVTEFDWATTPPGRGDISVALQARYLSLALYEFWRQGVAHALWLVLRDTPGALAELPGMGVYFTNGQAKPAVAAFRFPFVALRGRRGRVTLWGRAPAAGVVQIEAKRGRGWRLLTAVRSTGGGVFYTQRHLAARLVLRAVSGAVASRPWAIAG